MGARPLDYLAIGHLTKDLLAEGYAWGGVAYAALTAKGLGRRVGVVTSAGPDMDRSLFEGIELLCLPSPVTTTFRNIYGEEGRTQFIYARAEPIRGETIPLPWRGSAIVHLGPVAQELEEEMVWLFPRSLIGVAPQGWLRRWDEEGRILPRRWEGAERILPRVVLMVSEEDLTGEASALQDQLGLAALAVVTRGERGATLYYGGQERHFAPPETPLVDPTGAGDIFAAAFLVRLAESQDPGEAARFATMAASLSVAKPGLAAIPSREEIKRRLKDG